MKINILTLIYETPVFDFDALNHNSYLKFRKQNFNDNEFR